MSMIPQVQFSKDSFQFARCVRWLLLPGLLVPTMPVLAAPFIPANDAQVLERASIRPDSPQAREWRRLRQTLANQPRNLAKAEALARDYINQARASGDPRFLGYAQGVLAPWWQLKTPPEGVRILRATILQSSHRFEPALQDLRAVLKSDPGNAQAWLTSAAIYQVQGDYAQAKHHCLQLMGQAPSLTVNTCLAGVVSLNGQAGSGERLLENTLLQNQDASPDARLWALTVLAEIAERRGEMQKAQAHYQAALGLPVQDAYLKAAYADFLLDQKRPAEVLPLLAADTANDNLLLRLVLAEQALKAPGFQQHANLLRERYRASRARGDFVHQREEARFVLTVERTPVRALQLARINWQSQREPADVRILLEAARAAGDRASIAQMQTWVAARKLEDVRLAPLLTDRKPA